MDNLEKLYAEIAKLEQQNTEQDRRLKNLEHNHEAICQLTYVTKDLLEAVKELTSSYEGHEKRIMQLEKAPGEKLLKIKDAVILAIASALGGGLITWIFQMINTA